MSIKRVCNFCGWIDDGKRFMLEMPKVDLHICGCCIRMAHEACLEYNETKRKEAEQRARGDANSA